MNYSNLSSQFNSLHLAGWLFLFICVPNAAFSQILNIEKARLDSINKEKPFEITLGSKFSFYNRSAGEGEDSKFISFRNDLSAIYAPQKTSYVALGNLSYAENNRNNILNNGYFHLRSNFNYRKTWSQEVFVQAQYDRFRGLTDRYIAGAAIRWKAIDADKFQLIGASGPMFENEYWRIPSDENQIIEINFLKLSTYLIVRWDLSKNASINNIIYYQVGYDNNIEASRNRMSLASNINFKLASFLAFTFSVSMAYEDRPIVPITKFIYTVENGLTLTL